MKKQLLLILCGSAFTLTVPIQSISSASKAKNIESKHRKKEKNGQ